MLASLLPFCLLCTPQGPGAVTEILPLEHLVHQRAPVTPPPWGSLLRRADDGGAIDLLAADTDAETVAAGRIAALLGDLARDALDANRLHLSELHHSLLAVGEQAEVAHAKARLRQAAAVMARPVTIELAVWDAADRESPTPFLAPADYQRFAANRSPVWRRAATVHSGDAVALEHVRWSRYVRDLDVDVAQKQTIARPAIASYGDGAHAIVRAFQLFGADEFALHVQFAVARRRGVLRTLPTGMAAAADLELPTLETDFGACSGRIANGGALAVTLRGHADSGGQHILTVRAIAKTPPAPAAQDGFGLYPCGALTSATLTQRVRFATDGSTELDGGGVGHGHVPAEQLLGFVRESLGSDGEAAGVECGGGWLFVRGGPQVLAKVDALLRGVQERLVRNAAVVHTGAFAGADGAAAAGLPALHELVLPTLLGRDLCAVRCLETNVVAELHTAIAQEAAAIDPVVQALQSGCWLSARLSPRDDQLHLQLRVVQRHTVTPQARSVMPGGGTWMPAEVAVLTTSHDGAAGNGQALDHGDGPVLTADGRSLRSQLATTVRW